MQGPSAVFHMNGRKPHLPIAGIILESLVFPSGYAKVKGPRVPRDVKSLIGYPAYANDRSALRRDRAQSAIPVFVSCVFIPNSASRDEMGLKRL